MGKQFEADWAGALKLRFRWSRFRFEYGRMYYKTDCTGETIDSCWKWENK